MQDPLVTIIIQTFNRKNLLKFALSSAINQTYRNIEILIGDNCSQDGTDIYCEQEAQKDSRIKYFRHSQNIGMVGNANFLCDRVNGEYVVFLNDDDWLDVDYVEKCIAFFSENPSYSLVTPSTVLYPENCSNVGATGGELCKIIKLDSNNVHSRLITYLKNQDFVEMATGCFKTSILKKIKEIEGQYISDRYNEDIVFFMKFLATGKCKVLTNTHLNKRDGGFSKTLKTSTNVYTTFGITDKNLPRRRCQIFSSAIINDKYFSTLMSEKELKKLYKKLLNSLEWCYCQGKFRSKKYLHHIEVTMHLLFNYRLYSL